MNRTKGFSGNGQCHRCRHYYVSWNPQYPHGCRAFQMVTKMLPSLAVIRDSGEPCLFEEPKIQTTPKFENSEKPRKGWSA